MTYEFACDGFERIQSYFERIGGHLPDKRQRASVATYALGLLGSAERKSVEPLAALASAEPDDWKRLQNRLLDFLGRGRRQDEPVRLEAARYAIEALSARETAQVWVVDDTGFLKQGKQSVGVQRQYTDSAGKNTNCQIGVSLSIATAGEQVPIDFELYLPRTWMDDSQRRAVARIPADRVSKTKIDLAMDMIGRAVAADIPRGVLLADSAYGESSVFRGRLRSLGLDYGLGIHGPTNVYLVDATGQTIGEPIGARQLGVELGLKAFRRYTWPWRDSDT